MNTRELTTSACVIPAALRIAPAFSSAVLVWIWISPATIELAAGKGVFVCNDSKEGEAALNLILLDKAFGDSGEKVLIEEYLIGEEVSIFAISDGREFVCLPASQDHKRIGDDDKGKNTGGMGAYAPAPIVTAKLFEEIKNRIIYPVISTLAKRNSNFIGCLYAGLIITDEGPKVIEFNCRFGDPETQVVLPVIKGDFLHLLHSASIGKIDKAAVDYNGGSSVCVVAASEGYPDSDKKGFEINGLNELPGRYLLLATAAEARSLIGAGRSLTRRL